MPVCGQKVSKSGRMRKLEAIKKRQLKIQLRNSVPREKRIEENMVKVNEEKNRARVLQKEKEFG